jgi:hypothetical protein
MSRLRTSLSVAIVISVGLIVLAGYFLDIPMLNTLQIVFLRWAALLGAVALIVGVFNLFNVHLRKINTGQKGSPYSLVLIIALIATVLIVGLLGPTSFWSMWIFNYIHVPVESSLMALLAVVMAFAGARLLGRRFNAFSIIFILTALFVLAGSISLSFVDFPVLAELRAWIERVPTTAGARGILLGVALGTIATGFRLLMGADRPYGG